MTGTMEPRRFGEAAAEAGSVASDRFEMQEPHRSDFVRLVLSGAAARDMHASDGAGSYDAEPTVAASDAFVQRELQRVQMHARSLCEPLFRRMSGSPRILDVGCGTGGTTVALALPEFGAREVVGVDASASALEAARVRAMGHGMDPARVKFSHVAAGSSLPFATGEFDLVTCISVLEFVGNDLVRRAFVAELMRVLCIGGLLLLATPSPFHLFEYHSRRLLGDWRRSPGYPWASTPMQLRAMFAPHPAMTLARERMRRHPLLHRVDWVAPMVSWAFPWQQWLVRKTDSSTAS